MFDLLQPIADILGVSSSVVTTIVVVAAAMFLSLVVLRLTGSTALSILASGSIVIFGVFLGVLPLWVILLGGAFLIGHFIIGGVFNGQHTGVWVAALVGIMIAIVVGAFLLPAITETAKVAAEDSSTPTAVGELLDVLPIVFGVVVILGAVAWIGGNWGGSSEERSERREKVREFLGNAKELILSIERSSDNFKEYLNNLDDLLGIKTIVAKDNEAVPGVLELKGLYLNEADELWIDKSYDWYITDKLQDKDIFKVVGLHKEEAEENLVYLLGKDTEGSKTVLVSVPAEKYLEASCEQCLEARKVLV